VQKNILLAVLLITLFSGLYGCSCSQRPTEEPELTPGLYIDSFPFVEKNSGETLVNLNVRLERNSEATVTVNYEISASTSSSKALAIVGNDADADVRGTPPENTLIFDEASSDDVLTIPITIVSDTLYELDEVFTVELKAASGANIVEGVAEITIENDDDPPNASIELTDVNDSLMLSEDTLQRIGMKVSLDAISGVDASLKVFRSAETQADEDKYGTVGAYRIDYMLYQADEILPEEAGIIIPAGELEAFVDIEVIDDGIEENLEEFEISLVEQSHVSTASTVALNFSITDDDTITDGSVASMTLNDTGLLDLPGSIIPIELDSQVDKNFGRDSVSELVKTGAGRAAFDFNKIDANGDVMDDSADFSVTPWDCVRDNTTGLVWEVKEPGEATIRGSGQSFYWQDPNYNTNGGNPGVKGKYQCQGHDPVVDGPCISSTAYYVADMNVNKLCNMTGWRLPTVEELRSIADYSDASPHYDTDYFAGDTLGVKYIWTSSTVAVNDRQAWAIQFRDLIEEAREKESFSSHGIRLVNDSNVSNTE